MQEKQRIATAEQDDEADVFGYHFEAGSLAVNLFHVRAGKIVDRREFFWDELPELLEAVNSDEGDPPDQDYRSFRSQSDVDRPPLKHSGIDSHIDSTRVDRAPQSETDPASQYGELGHSGSQFHAGPIFSALLKQLYIDQQYVPRTILVPVDFADRETLTNLLSTRTGYRIDIAVPLRGEKRSLVDLAGQNAKQSYTQRFRTLAPSRKAIQEALADILMLPDLPRRIECFDISHIQGAETVASLVVWEDGKMNKQLYRKFKVMTVLGVDDFASMREVVYRRYRRLLGKQDPSLAASTHASLNLSPDKDISEDKSKPKRAVALASESTTPGKEPETLPSLILVDGGLGQLHAAAEALESLGLTSQPLASIAKREEVIYLHGNEDEPIVLDRRSPVLHLIQLIRDESHRFAIGYHRQRRAMRDRDSELLNIQGVGPSTRQRLLAHFGSLREVQQASAESLTAVVSRKTAEMIYQYFHPVRSGS